MLHCVSQLTAVFHLVNINVVSQQVFLLMFFSLIHTHYTIQFYSNIVVPNVSNTLFSKVTDFVKTSLFLQRI